MSTESARPDVSEAPASGRGAGPRVSVVTAVRNGAAGIAATLESVNVQMYPDIEHVVVDGSSTDGTLDIVRARGRRVARLVSEPDRGVYDAFDKGLRLATGDVVAYLNAGDVFASADVVKTVAARFAGDPELEAVIGDVDIVGAAEQSRVVRRYRCASFRGDRLRDGFMPAHPAMFVSRATYLRVGGYDASYRIAGDFEFCVRAFAVHRIRYVHVGAVLVRMPSGGLSTSGWRSNWIITKEMHRACVSNGIATSYARLLARFPVKAIELLRRS